MSTFMILKCMPLYLQWHSKLPWNMQEKRLFWSKGEMEVPLEFANSCDQPIFYAKSCYRIKTWKNTIAYAGKNVQNLCL